MRRITTRAESEQRGRSRAAGGWKVTIKGDIIIGSSSTRGLRIGGTITRQIPMFLGKLQLIDPKGTVVSERPINAGETADTHEGFYDDLAILRPRKAWSSSDSYERSLAIAAEHA